MPKFHHRFTPARGSVLGNSVDLATRQIEDAGILEVLQTPGAALGTWAVFDALLVPGHEWFVFHSPLAYISTGGHLTPPKAQAAPDRVSADAASGLASSQLADSDTPAAARSPAIPATP